MKNAMETALLLFARRPRNLFLMDSLGALLTAALLFFVLRRFSIQFGMPPKVLSSLSIVALLFCIYSGACYFLLRKRWPLFIGIIAVANLLYCLCTAGLVFVHRPLLTTLGVAYFLLELLIVAALAFFELRLALLLQKTGRQLHG